jgi:hypothetical protein
MIVQRRHDGLDTVYAASIRSCQFVLKQSNQPNPVALVT